MSNSAGNRRSPLTLFPGQPTPRLYHCVVEALRTRQYSRRTEEAYVHWIRSFLVFHNGTHPRETAGMERDVQNVGACVRRDRFRTCMSSVIRWRRGVMESSFAKWNWLQAGRPCFRNGAHIGRHIRFGLKSMTFAS